MFLVKLGSICLPNYVSRPLILSLAELLWRHIVLFSVLSLLTKSKGVTIQMKPLQQYFCMVPFVF